MQSRKQRNIMFGVVAVVGILMIVYVFLNYKKTNRFVKYTDASAGYELKYPATWTFADSYQGVNVMFFTPKDNAMDLFQENVSVNIQDISQTPRTLKEYTKEAIDQMKMIFGQYMVVLESKDIYLDGIPAHKFVILGKNSDVDVQLMFVWAIDSLKVYQLTFSSRADTYERYSGNFEKIKNSFRFLK